MYLSPVVAGFVEDRLGVKLTLRAYSAGEDIIRNSVFAILLHATKTKAL